jgi:hypothetical protein
MSDTQSRVDVVSLFGGIGGIEQRHYWKCVGTIPALMATGAASSHTAMCGRMQCSLCITETGPRSAAKFDPNLPILLVARRSSACNGYVIEPSQSCSQ